MELLSRDHTICGGLFTAQRVQNRRLSKPNTVSPRTLGPSRGRDALGYRVLSRFRLKSRKSTLAARPDGHLNYAASRGA